MPITLLTDLTKMTTDELILALSDIVYGRHEDPESATLYEIVDELESRCADTTGDLTPASRSQ